MTEMEEMRRGMTGEATMAVVPRRTEEPSDRVESAWKGNAAQDMLQKKIWESVRNGVS